MQNKQCKKCKEIKSLSEFGKHKGRKDGLSEFCLLCSRKLRTDYDKKFPWRRTLQHIKQRCLNLKCPAFNSYGGIMQHTKYTKLYSKAKSVSKNTYSPYSKFPVGAAVLTSKGDVFIGTNVENASYGLTICAERAAICNAVSYGAKDIVAIAIYSKKNSVGPCGACRQFILEFGQDIDVIFKNNNKFVINKIINLMPNAFTGRELTK